jgi:2-amino-4-hydroxy-6-hydroxymethyldihydropteridine diphosphokinase
MPEHALIGLGSNLGHREEALRKATALLAEAGQLYAWSAVYETQPWGLPADTPEFLNAVVLLGTGLTAEELWAYCVWIEQQLGRQRRWGELSAVRCIDIDLLLYGSLVVRSEHLCIPHPRFHLRRFSLVPATDIAPEFRHPLLGKSIGSLLSECTDPCWVRPYGQLAL